MNFVENYARIFSLSGPLDLLYAAVTHLGPLFALMVGRRLERAVAGVYLVGVVISWGAVDLERSTAATDAYAALAICYLFALGTIALRRGAPAWTLFATAFQLVQTMTWLLALAAAVPVTGFAFLTMTRAWDYLFVFALAVGAWNSRRSAPEPGARGAGLQGPAPDGARG